MIVDKLTNQDMTTYNGFRWELGQWRETSGEGELCGPGWLHAYEHPLLAVLHNPIHGDIASPRLFEADTGDGKIKRDGQMKLGTTRLKLIREIDVPEISHEQRIKYGILCAKQVCKNQKWNDWADKWLSGEDRSEESARATAESAATWAAAAAVRAAAVREWAAQAAEWAAAQAANINLIEIAEMAIAKVAGDR